MDRKSKETSQNNSENTTPKKSGSGSPYKVEGLNRLIDAKKVEQALLKVQKEESQDQSTSTSSLEEASGEQSYARLGISSLLERFRNDSTMTTENLQKLRELEGKATTELAVPSKRGGETKEGEFKKVKIERQLKEDITVEKLEKLEDDVEENGKKIKNVLGQLDENHPFFSSAGELVKRQTEVQATINEMVGQTGGANQSVIDNLRHEMLESLSSEQQEFLKAAKLRQITMSDTSGGLNEGYDGENSDNMSEDDNFDSRELMDLKMDIEQEEKKLQLQINKYLGIKDYQQLLDEALKLLSDGKEEINDKEKDLQVEHEKNVESHDLSYSDKIKKIKGNFEVDSEERIKQLKKEEGERDVEIDKIVEKYEEKRYDIHDDYLGKLIKLNEKFPKTDSTIGSNIGEPRAEKNEYIENSSKGGSSRADSTIRNSNGFRDSLPTDLEAINDDPVVRAYRLRMAGSGNPAIRDGLSSSGIVEGTLYHMRVFRQVLSSRPIYQSYIEGRSISMNNIENGISNLQQQLEGLLNRAGNTESLEQSYNNHNSNDTNYFDELSADPDRRTTQPLRALGQNLDALSASNNELQRIFAQLIEERSSDNIEKGKGKLQD